MYELRPYQRAAVDATLAHFRQTRDAAVVVLPTGAGKSLVIAELARIARGRVLVLAHVKELVEQNHGKYESFGQGAGIYSAGLDRKDRHQKVLFGSIQSIARASDDFFEDFSLLVIDECHRVSTEGDTQYLQVIAKLRERNPTLCVLGLTATPYRLGFGWIYEFHSHRGMRTGAEGRFFKTCVFELTTREMIRDKYLTPPVRIDSPTAAYDFSSLDLNGSPFVTVEIERILRDQKRITPLIVRSILEMSVDRRGVMIFTSTVRHANEILKLLPAQESALVVGDTPAAQRDQIVTAFKARELRFLVNVSVLTTGFDAPHVDVIAILRPTESASLYQQIIGRGLRLAPEKDDCLVLDYTGQGHDLYTPDIEDGKPSSEAVIADVECPACGFVNSFWALLDPEDGSVIEHFGRRCKGARQISSKVGAGRLDRPMEVQIVDCGFRFRFKLCERCQHENDVSARQCGHCHNVLVDDDKKLKEAMSLSDAHVMNVETMIFERGADKRGSERLEVSYYDADANVLKEYFYINSLESRRAFYFNFARMHKRVPEKKFDVRSVEEAVSARAAYRQPLFVIARKEKYFWKIREKIFADAGRAG